MIKYRDQAMHSLGPCAKDYHPWPKFTGASVPIVDSVRFWRCEELSVYDILLIFLLLIFLKPFNILALKRLDVKLSSILN
jgi:hypothetical protein